MIASDLPAVWLLLLFARILRASYNYLKQRRGGEKPLQEGFVDFGAKSLITHVTVAQRVVNT